MTDDGVLHCFSPEAPDAEAPDVFRMVPVSGLAMSGAPPIKMSAILYDIGSGVDFSSAAMLLDGQPVDSKIDYVTSTISYQTEAGDPDKPVRALKDGVHTITVTAKDYAGNSLNKQWFFIADASLPPPKRVKAEGKRTAPPGGACGSQPGGGNRGSQSGDEPPPPPPPPMAGPDSGTPGAPSAPGGYGGPGYGGPGYGGPGYGGYPRPGVPMPKMPP